MITKNAMQLKAYIKKKAAVITRIQTIPAPISAVIIRNPHCMKTAAALIAINGAV